MQPFNLNPLISPLIKPFYIAQFDSNVAVIVINQSKSVQT